MVINKTAVYQHCFEQDSPGTSDIELGTPNTFLGVNRRTWCCLGILLAFVVGCVSTGFFTCYVVKRCTDPTENVSTGPTPQALGISSIEQQNDDAKETRVLRVKGSDRCAPPHCKKCETGVYKHPPSFKDVCANLPRFKYTITSGSEACIKCKKSECLNYTAIAAITSFPINCDNVRISKEEKCCLMYDIANKMGNFCNGGKLKCEDKSSEPKCICPPGKTGNRCEQDASSPNIYIPCSCHKDVHLCEDDIAQCEHVYYNQTDTGTCQRTIKGTNGGFYSCYCKNTEQAAGLPACDELRAQASKQSSGVWVVMPSSSLYLYLVTLMFVYPLMG